MSEVYPFEYMYCHNRLKPFQRSKYAVFCSADGVTYWLPSKKAVKAKVALLKEEWSGSGVFPHIDVVSLTHVETVLVY